MTDAPSTQNDNLANDLFGSLASDADFTIPAVDLTGAEFAVPDGTNSDLYGSITQLTQEDLTTKVPDGTGMFDTLMSGMGAHIQQEYDSGRITGNEYASAYVAMVQSALSMSVQYLLGRDQAYWSAALAQQQARAAEAGVVKTRLEVEIGKAALKTARIDANIGEANYALTKLKLATESSQKDLQDKALEKASYEVSYLLPAQLIQIQEQTSQITAQKDQVLYNTASVLPAQKANVEADTTAKAYQNTDILPAQKAGLDADNAAKLFNNANILPAQHSSLLEQNEAHRAKTMDTRSDGTTPVAGAIGVQKDLQKQQIKSYENDGQYKLGKMLMDSWITQKSLDEAIPQPEGVTNTNIDAVLAQLRTNLGLT